MKDTNGTKKAMGRTVVLFFVVLLVAVLLTGVPTQAEETSSPAKQVAEEQVVVEVNGTKFTRQEMDEKLNRTLASVQGMISPDQLEQFKESMESKLVEDFVTRTLINEEIKKNKITVEESEVTEAMGEIASKVPEGMTLEDMLKQGGVTMEEMKENIVFSLRANKLFDSQVRADYTPSDAEILKYYNDNKKKFEVAETVHARHILIKVDEKDDDKIKGEKKTKIDGLRKQLVEGAAFEKLAKENSDCPSKEKGGDLGTFPRGRMVKPFEDAAFTQKVNEIGPVVETQFGYHVIQVLEHNQGDQKSLDQVKDTITVTLQNQKNQELAKNYLDGLKQKAKIVYGTSVEPPK